MKITLQDLEQNIKTLPENFYGQVNDFIDFLKHKHFKEKQYKVSEWEDEDTRRMKYAKDYSQSLSEFNIDDDLEVGD
ncbi:DUF2281 domain-containing protein [Chryseobacterium sp. RU37D]|uniref:DUF2281 domain-containing protein n=1 Tax=Chryseobacterium sp. RU37D TaxID=1907397 RepID=UPI0015C3B146|nr:DUF2281 domain-containing protein [Chryseobacterium sp. RU37D]